MRLRGLAFGFVSDMIHVHLGHLGGHVIDQALDQREFETLHAAGQMKVCPDRDTRLLRVLDAVQVESP